MLNTELYIAKLAKDMAISNSFSSVAFLRLMICMMQDSENLLWQMQSGILIQLDESRKTTKIQQFIKNNFNLVHPGVAPRSIPVL